MSSILPYYMFKKVRELNLIFINYELSRDPKIYLLIKYLAENDVEKINWKVNANYLLFLACLALENKSKCRAISQVVVISELFI